MKPAIVVIFHILVDVYEPLSRSRNIIVSFRGGVRGRVSWRETLASFVMLREVVLTYNSSKLGFEVPRRISPTGETLKNANKYANTNRVKFRVTIE
jgi:hypothetical protein